MSYDCDVLDLYHNPTLYEWDSWYRLDEDNNKRSTYGRHPYCEESLRSDIQNYLSTSEDLEADTIRNIIKKYCSEKSISDDYKKTESYSENINDIQLRKRLDVNSTNQIQNSEDAFEKIVKFPLSNFNIQLNNFILDLDTTLSIDNIIIKFRCFLLHFWVKYAINRYIKLEKIPRFYSKLINSETFLHFLIRNFNKKLGKKWSRELEFSLNDCIKQLNIINNRAYCNTGILRTWIINNIIPQKLILNDNIYFKNNGWRKNFRELLSGIRLYYLVHEIYTVIWSKNNNINNFGMDFRHKYSLNVINDLLKVTRRESYSYIIKNNRPLLDFFPIFVRNFVTGNFPVRIYKDKISLINGIAQDLRELTADLYVTYFFKRLCKRTLKSKNTKKYIGIYPYKTEWKNNSFFIITDKQALNCDNTIFDIYKIAYKNNR